MDNQVEPDKPTPEANKNQPFYITDDDYRDFESIEVGAAATLKKFHKFDQDNNGFLTTKEIDLAEDDPLSQLSNRERNFLTTIKRNHAHVDCLKSDTLGESVSGLGNGVSRNDLYILLNQARTVREDIRHARRIRALNFYELDNNKDSFITNAELDRLVRSPQATEEQRETLLELKQERSAWVLGLFTNRSHIDFYARKFDGDKYQSLRKITDGLPRRDQPLK